MAPTLYNLEVNSPYLSGAQALVRAMLDQVRADRAAGQHTAGFMSGYRGSPLGHVDRAMWAAGRELEALDIRFRPGVNEDLAATAVWGSQQTGTIRDPKFTGVIGLRYGKAPRLDRSLDAIRHASASAIFRRGPASGTRSSTACSATSRKTGAASH